MIIDNENKNPVNTNNTEGTNTIDKNSVYGAGNSVYHDHSDFSFKNGKSKQLVKGNSLQPKPISNAFVKRKPISDNYFSPKKKCKLEDHGLIWQKVYKKEESLTSLKGKF